MRWPADSPAVELVSHVTGSGPPLLLITGTGYPAATWPADFLQTLAEHVVVITFDHRGTGASPGTGGRYTTRLFAADAIRVLDRLEIEAVHVLGHSMGGRVAQWMALDEPARVRTLILAASGPGHFDEASPQTGGIPVPAALGLIERGYEGYIRSLITRTFFTPEFATDHPERVDALINAFWSNRPPLEDYLKHVVARQEHRTTDQLHKITQPTLVVVGDRDTHVGGTGSHWDQSRYLADHIPRAELHVIKDAQHGFFWSAAEQTAAIIRRWIERHHPAAAHDYS